MPKGAALAEWKYSTCLALLVALSCAEILQTWENSGSTSYTFLPHAVFINDDMIPAPL